MIRTNEVLIIKRNGKMLEKVIHSQYLKESMTLKIYLPESYSPLYKHKLCIMQDGNDYYQLGKIATLSDKLHHEGTINSVIFVGIHYKDKFDRRNKYHPDGKQHILYSAFLAHEVVPFLDDTFSTENLGNARTLMGDSLAGTLALLTALKYPHTFGNIIIQSPYINEDVLKIVNETKDLSIIDVYHSVGTDETAVKTTTGEIIDFITTNRQLNKLFLAHSGKYHYKEFPNGEHTWKYWQQELPEILHTMFYVAF